MTATRALHLFHLLVFSTVVRGGKNCSVLSYGALCDGRSDDTAAIQATLDECSGPESSVTIPAGRTCLSQPLTLLNDTHLVLSPKSILKAGQKWKDNTTFVSARHKENVWISGSGTLDGSGAQWWTGNNTPGRPLLLDVWASNVVLEDFSLLNGATKHLHVEGNNFLIRNIKINSPNYTIAPETDGIDVRAKDVWIDGVEVTNGDDSICMKGGAENVLVTNSIVRRGNGLVIGTGASPYIRNITFRNCRAENTKFGCHIKDKDAQIGEVYDVLFENIIITDPTECALDINQQGQGLGHPQSDVRIHSVTFRNITGTAKQAGYFWCKPSLPCTNITIENVHLKCDEGCTFYQTFGNGTDVDPVSCVPPRNV